MHAQVVRDADAIILGAPGRQGGMCGEMRLFLDSLAPLQVERKGNAAGAMKVCHSHTQPYAPASLQLSSPVTWCGAHGRVLPEQTGALV